MFAVMRTALAISAFYRLRSSERPKSAADEGGNPVKLRLLRVFVLVAGVVVVGAAYGQQQPPAGAPDLNAVPDKMPFNIPFGTPISYQKAQDVVQAGIAEATKRGWPENFAVVDTGGNLVAFARMDGSQLASISIAEHKARTAARYRRPTRAFEDAVQKFGFNYILTLDDVIASRGGIPLVVDGKIIGAVGCSGATGSQDEVLCKVAAEAASK
jgi:glc operon protein GlcG